jgi:triosephosphate isomerase
MKKLLMGTNLKMYKTIRMTVDYLEALQASTIDLRERVQLFVVPSYTALDAASGAIRDKSILLGAQNVHPEEQGQFTGEISPLMLREIGVDIVEIGHSERRHVFHETDAEENLKVLSALDHGFTALLCVGETARQKEDGIADEILRIQLKIGMKGVRRETLDRLWIAYEPVWAIGVHGIPASAEYAGEKHRIIGDALKELFPNAKIPVLYGGSVNAGNVRELIARETVDGLFVGRAAWGAENFDALIRQALPVWNDRNRTG